MPFLIDANTGTEMYESEDIIDYLHAEYGQGRSGVFRLAAPLNSLGAMVASGVRPRGSQAKIERTNQPDELLVLYNFEASPYCRKVREALNELDLHHRVRNVGKGSERRKELIALGGKMMVPFLVDPNTDTQMYESDAIIAYLWKAYGHR